MSKDKTQDRKEPWKIIYEVIDGDPFDVSKIKFPEELLIKCKEEFNVPKFIPHHAKKNIQQVCIEYGLFSQIVRIKREVVVVVDKSSKAKPKNNHTEEK